MKLKFDTHGNERQKEVCRLWADSTTTDILYGGSKGSGKTYLGCSLICGNALIYDGTSYFIARKNGMDLVKYTIPSILEVLNDWQIPTTAYTYNGQYRYFQFFNDSRVYLVEARYYPTDPMYERFGSRQYTQGWIEEGGEFSKDAKTYLQASLGRWKNKEYNLLAKLLITCNPSRNFLYGDYYLPFVKNELPEWRKFVSALPTDNKMLPQGYIDMLERTLDQHQRERLLMGNWDFDDDPHWMVTAEAIEDMFTNDFVKSGKRYISTDLAGKGSDIWVVGLWNGLRVKFPIHEDYSEGKEMQEKLVDLANRWSVPRSQIVADSDGLGFYLESYFRGIQEFHGGGRAFNADLYTNLKSECFFKLAELIEKRQIYVECDDNIKEQIKIELSAMRMTDLDFSGKKRAVISKDQQKKLIGHSPNYLDTLMMRMIFEVNNKAAGLDKGIIEPVGVYRWQRKM